METYFAPAERSTQVELAKSIQLVTDNPIMDGLVHAANCLFAVVNCQRQVIAINQSFLKLVGIENAEETLGLRLGEIVKCIHADETGGGCGTSSYCSTCGAVIAMLAAIGGDEPVERSCAIQATRNNEEVELFFQVRCGQVDINHRKFILIFLQDFTAQQQRANLESVFFHDINNMFVGLTYLNEHLDTADHSVIETFQKQFARLAQEFSIQRALAASMSNMYQPLYLEARVGRVLLDLKRLFTGNPLVIEKQLQVVVENAPGELSILTDECLVHRILQNMITNAVEASERGGIIRLSAIAGENAVTFKVWSGVAIPDDIAKRVFQRNFSTKNELGHGLGTYSMKFFGESILGGKVDFTTSVADGTAFNLTLPNRCVKQQKA